MSPTYKALALQVTCRAVNHAVSIDQAREKIIHNIQCLAPQIAASKGFIGSDTRLVVLPEYFMTGFPMGESIPEWKARACIAPEGPEYERLSKIAQENKLFLSGNAYETDRHFPELYFQTSFVIAPSGDLILRYRRLNSMFAPTPHDVWDQYLDIYGLEGVFPVARTEIGNLACIASEEILYPEIARCLAMRGAEVFLHSSSEIGSPSLTPKNIAKQERAIENAAYVISANSAGIDHIPIPKASTDGGSRIIDFHGRITAEASAGESMVANAEILPDALREYRKRPGMNNMLSRQRFELYADSYASHCFYPSNTLLGKKAERRHFTATQQAVIQRLAALNII